jgi:predicted transposase YbfD/YdcC
VVLGQVDVAAKTNEIPMFATLLDRIDIAGAIITADAMHAQRTHAQYLVGRRGAHYVLTVKRNQPHLHTLLAALPWREVPVADDTRDRGHGRTEWRTGESHRRGRRTGLPARRASHPDHPTPPTA